MRIAVVQTAPQKGATESNRAGAIRWIERVPAALYVLPELAFSGYNFRSAREARALSEPLTGATFRALATVCAERKVHVAYGFPERRGPRLYNSAALVGPRGLVGLYRKVHLFGKERAFFSSGRAPFQTWRVGDARVGMMICYDWIFPEAMRCLALDGADLVLHPANLVLPHCPDAMVTRSLENRVYTATADRVGVETGAAGHLGFQGRSQVVSPSGEVVVRLDGRREGVGVAVIDPRSARDKRLPSGNDLFKDRRPALYRGANPRSRRLADDGRVY